MDSNRKRPIILKPMRSPRLRTPAFSPQRRSLARACVGAFALVGLGSLPSGRLGDLWGRRRMMLIFFFGMGGAAILAALTQNAWQLAAALTLLGAFASIYHPVGIPMLVRDSRRPGLTIGVNGLPWDAPVKRVSPPDAPQEPFAPVLADHYLPDSNRIAQAIRETVAY